MVSSCSVCNCSARFNKHSDISFHRFPSEPELCRKWVEAIGRNNFIPDTNSRVCSQHFKLDDFERLVPTKVLKKSAIPSLVEYFEYCCMDNNVKLETESGETNRFEAETDQQNHSHTTQQTMSSSFTVDDTVKIKDETDANNQISFEYQTLEDCKVEINCQDALEIEGVKMEPEFAANIDEREFEHLSSEAMLEDESENVSEYQKPQTDKKEDDISESDNISIHDNITFENMLTDESEDALRYESIKIEDDISESDEEVASRNLLAERMFKSNLNTKWQKLKRKIQPDEQVTQKSESLSVLGFTYDDMSNPEKALLLLKIAKMEVADKNKQIKIVRSKNSQMEKKIEKMKKSIARLRTTHE